MRFNDLQRGLPRMSSSLLSRRLKELEYANIIERKPAAKGGGSEYHLTDAGRDLLPIVEGMGIWAQRWVRDDLVADENLDPDLLMWDVRRNVTAEGIPADRRFVVLFEFSGMPSNHRRYWLVFERGEADLCVKDPGFDVDLQVAAAVRALTEVWLGRRSLNDARREESLQLEGTQHDVGKFKDWFALSTFAEEGRKPPRRLGQR